MSQSVKHILFTGATSGLGKVAAMELANRGALVVAFVRNPTKANTLLTDYAKRYPSAKGRIELIECDLASLKSIDRACNIYIDRYADIDILINNAGVWTTKRQTSADGIELTLAVNLLAPSLILQKMIPLLKKSAEPRVINTASALHQGTVALDDLEFGERPFSGFRAYRQSKLGLIQLGRLMAKKLENSPIAIFSQHPGVVATELARDSGLGAKLFFRLFGKSPAKGAQTLLYLVDAPISSLTRGEYYANRRQTPTTEEAYNLITAEQLHQKLNAYLGVHLGSY